MAAREPVRVVPRPRPDASHDGVRGPRCLGPARLPPRAVGQRPIHDRRHSPAHGTGLFGATLQVADQHFAPVRPAVDAVVTRSPGDRVVVRAKRGRHERSGVRLDVARREIPAGIRSLGDRVTRRGETRDRRSRVPPRGHSRRRDADSRPHGRHRDPRDPRGLRHVLAIPGLLSCLHVRTLSRSVAAPSGRQTRNATKMGLPCHLPVRTVVTCASPDKCLDGSAELVAGRRVTMPGEDCPRG